MVNSILGWICSKLGTIGKTDRQTGLRGCTADVQPKNKLDKNTLNLLLDQGWKLRKYI